jgi:dTDP-4-amino-4,6-dideoxygalactose transaminase
MIAMRRHNAMYITALLSDLDDKLQLPFVPEDRSHSYMMYPIVITDERIIKEDLTGYLEEHGVRTREMLPLINQPAYSGMWTPQDYPMAQWIDRNGFYIGCHNGLVDEDIEYVSEVFHGYFGKQK